MAEGASKACRQSSAEPKPEAESLVVVVAVIRRRLHLVNPVPLTACDLDCHGAGDNFLKGVDGGEHRDAQAQDQDGRNVEKQILCLHEKLVVAPDQQTGAVPVGDVVLRDVLPQLAGALWGISGDNPSLAALLDEVDLRRVGLG